MSERPIIIKKKKVVGGHGHHGGAWKVAYADFVTAMMAFFLLMWLLNATTEDQRKGIADYFNPTIPISRISGGGTGALKGDSIFSEDEKLAQSRTGGIEGELGKRNEARVLSQVDLANSEGRAVNADAKLLKKIQSGLENALGGPQTGDLVGQHILTRSTAEGLVIELVEQDAAPLFTSGSTRPSTILKILLQAVAETTQGVGNSISIVGHTDARPIRSRPNYSNWELSADRANVARRELIAAGMKVERIVRVSGEASMSPLFDDPFAPQNRRIAITLLR